MLVHMFEDTFLEYNNAIQSGEAAFFDHDRSNNILDAQYSCKIIHSTVIASLSSYRFCCSMFNLILHMVVCINNNQISCNNKNYMSYTCNRPSHVAC